MTLLGCTGVKAFEYSLKDNTFDLVIFAHRQRFSISEDRTRVTNIIASRI